MKKTIVILIFMLTFLNYASYGSACIAKENKTNFVEVKKKMLSVQGIQCANTIGNYIIIVGTMADGNTYVTIADVNTGKDVDIQITPAIGNLLCSIINLF
jgi:hypothetical protein